MAATTLEGVETAMNGPLLIGLPVSSPATAKRELQVLCVMAAAVALHQQT